MPIISAMVSREISENRFEIRTERPGLKVSWQVTGVRRDRYATAYGMPVEHSKPAGERGLYQAPELYGQPASKGISQALAARPPHRPGS